MIAPARQQYICIPIRRTFASPSMRDMIVTGIVCGQEDAARKTARSRIRCAPVTDAKA